MPLVVLAGHPSSGKTTVAALLADLCQQAGATVRTVNEESLHLDRGSVYASAGGEKDARASLKSAVERLVSRGEVLLADSLNAIKGFRYELWCVARGAATRHCVVHVDTPPDRCREWNRGRPPAAAYPDHILEDLLRRFETPDTRSKWDRPMFTVRPAGPPDEAGAALRSVVAAMTDAAGPGLAGASELVPTLAVYNPALLETNTLHQVDRAAQEVIGRIMEAQTSAGGGAAGTVDLGGASLDLRLPVTMAELRRHKRGFLRLATQSFLSRVTSEDVARRTFAEYLQRCLHEGGGAGGG